MDDNNQQEWLTDTCLCCSSINHLYFGAVNGCFQAVDAWECWNCAERWWYDELGQESYMLVHGCTKEEADSRLREGGLFIINGAYEQR